LKTYKVLSRYKAAHKFIELDENTFQFFPHKDDNPYMRAGFNEQGNIEFIDPPGGPFIRVGYSLNELVDNKMPDRNITEIKWDDDHYKLILDPNPRNDVT
jgi:hypothetical protein